MNVIFDNDAATDDMLALIYLATHPSVTIKAITVTGTGEAEGAKGAQNIASVLHMLGKGSVPIAFGAENRGANGKPFPDWLRNIVNDILKNTTLPKNPSPSIQNSPVDLIKQTLESSDEKVTIVVTGPLTNISDLVKTHPHLLNKIERVVIMGGAVYTKGNIQGLDKKSMNFDAEWNIYADPEAAQTVFSSDLNITLVPLDSTNKVPIKKEFIETLQLQFHPALHLIYQLLKDIIDAIGEDEFYKEFHFWDPLAAMICVNPDLANIKKVPLSVDLNSAKIKPHDENNQENAKIIEVSVDVRNPEKILTQFVHELKSHLTNNPILNSISDKKHATLQYGGAPQNEVENQQVLQNQQLFSMNNV